MPENGTSSTNAAPAKTATGGARAEKGSISPMEHASSAASQKDTTSNQTPPHKEQASTQTHTVTNIVDASTPVPTENFLNIGRIIQGNERQITIKLAVADREAAALKVSEHPGIRMDTTSGIITLTGKAHAIRQILSQVEMLPMQSPSQPHPLRLDVSIDDGLHVKSWLLTLHFEPMSGHIVPIYHTAYGSSSPPAHDSEINRVPSTMSGITEKGVENSETQAPPLLLVSATNEALREGIPPALFKQNVAVRDNDPKPANNASPPTSSTPTSDTLVPEADKEDTTNDNDTEVETPSSPDTAKEAIGSDTYYAPTADVPGNLTTPSATALVLTAANAPSVSDLDSTSLTVTISATHGTLSLSGLTGLTFSTGDGTADATMTFSGSVTDINTALDGMSFTSDALFVGTASVGVVAADDISTGTYDFNINVSSNPPAVATPIPDQAALIGSALNLDVSSNFSDPEGDPLTFAATLADGSALPAWLSFDADTHIFSGTPAAPDKGYIAVKVTVTDTIGGSTSDTFDIAAYTYDIEGTAGADNLSGSGINQVISGLDGGDTLNGGGGQDTIIGGSGNDSLVGSSANEGNGNRDVIYGGDGNDTIEGRSYYDFLYGGEGDDVITAFYVHGRLYGEGGNDFLTGTVSFHDIMDGGSGDDTLKGNSGIDTMTGGTGSDVFLYDGPGHSSTSNPDLITDFEQGSDVIDVSALGYTGIVASGAISGQLEYSDDGTYTYISDPIGNFKIKLTGVYTLTNTDFVFGTITGTSGDDSITGTAGNDGILGLAGNDTIIGGGGQDGIDGGDGDDSIRGSSANESNGGGDILRGGAGNDTVQGTSYYDTLYGGEGDDVLNILYVHGTLYGEGGNDLLTGVGYNEKMDGGSGNDTLLGGGGVDNMTGGTGSDIFLYDGAGQSTATYTDLITDFEQGIDQISITPLSYTGIVAAGAVSGELQYSDDGSYTTIIDPFSTFTIKLTGVYALTDSDFIFGDINGTNGDDSITGTTGTDGIFGLDGNDTIIGGGGRDGINGGDGDDSLVGSLTTETNGYGDIIRGGAGNDTVQGMSYYDSLYGGDGDDVISSYVHGRLYGEEGNDYLTGNVWNDIMDGGTGNDTLKGSSGVDNLTGGTGSDVFLFDNRNQSTSSNPDTITDFEQGTDVIDISNLGYTGIVASGAASGELEYNDDGTYTYVFDPSSTFKIKLTGVYAMADGDFVLGTINGTAGADSITGTAGSDGIFGLDGNDTIIGGGGADAIVGGDGDDSLVGSLSSETSNSYADIIRGGAGNDTIEGNSLNDKLYGGDGDDVITMIYVQGYLYGEDGNDQLNGNGWWDVMDGGAGDDTLKGGGNNGGGDTMTGGTGSDVFLFVATSNSTDSARDVITDFEDGLDLFDISALGLAGFGDLAVSLSGGNTVIEDTGSTFAFQLTGDFTAVIDATDFIF